MDTSVGDYLLSLFDSLTPEQQSVVRKEVGEYYSAMPEDLLPEGLADERKERESIRQEAELARKNLRIFTRLVR